MRILYVNPNPLPSSETESLQVIQTTCAMAGKCSVRLISAKGNSPCVGSFYNLKIPDSLTIDFIPQLKIYWGPLRLSWNLLFSFLCLITIVLDTKKNKTDAIVVRNLKLGEFLLKWRKFFTHLPPIIFESHEIFTLSFEDEKKRFNKGTGIENVKLANRERFVYEQSDGLICTSNHLKECIKLRFAIPGDIVVAPNGIDIGEFLIKSDRCEKNQNQVDKTILYIGSLHHWKGIDVLLDAMVTIPDARLLVVGGTKETVLTYKKKADTLKIDDRVTFFGYVAPGKRHLYFDRASICVLPLLPVSVAAVSSSLKMFEYMAAQKAIVASSLPTIREVLIDKKNSILVSPGSAESLAEGIACLLNDVSLKERLSKQARLDVLDYTWERRTDKIKDYIKKNWG